MDAPFDRGEVDRASLDATERLRARLSGRPVAPVPAQSRSKLPWVFAGGLFVFSAGMIANPWFEDMVRERLPFAQRVLPVTAIEAALAPAEVKALKQRIAQLETRAGSATAPPSERMARTEAQLENSTDQIARDAGRIDRLMAEVAALSATIAADRARSETATTMAVAAADRAQGMLTLVLARRAIDSGRNFGPLDAVLRRSFEARYPEAVSAVSALGAAPVTLMSLRRDFNMLLPAIGVSPANASQSWWETLTGTISAAVSGGIGAAGADGAPQAAAAAALDRGDVAAAANHLRRLPLPRAPAVTNWLAAAQRLQTGSGALATLETATVLASPAASPMTLPTAPEPAPARAAENSRISNRFWQVGDILGRVHSLLDPRTLFRSAI